MIGGCAERSALHCHLIAHDLSPDSHGSGVRSYQRAILGVTLILVATQIVVTVRIPRPIGYVMVLSGLAYIAQGIVVGAEDSHRTGQCLACSGSSSTWPG
jgi:hypothetical protein